MGALNWRFNTNPKADGEYLLAQFREFSEEPYYVSNIGYTTDGGWNTSRSWVTGEAILDHGWGFEPSLAWAWIPIEETGIMQAKKENAVEVATDEQRQEK